MHIIDTDSREYECFIDINLIFYLKDGKFSIEKWLRIMLICKKKSNFHIA